MKETNVDDIREIIFDMIVSPTQTYHKWAQKTKQTEHPSSGYAAQHIVSLLIQEAGTKSAARGLDIQSGSEIKACSRVGQIDTCKKCKSHVYKSETNCSHCQSCHIKRNDDSKWLFTVHSQDDIKRLCSSQRILLFIDDYPEFDNGNFNKIRLQLFEILPQAKRHKNFRRIMNTYYNDVYKPNKKLGKRPAPKNFWPYSKEFYECAPLLTFSATVDNVYTALPKDIVITKYVPASVDRRILSPETRP